MLLQRNIVLSMEGQEKAALCKPDKTVGESSRSAHTPGWAATGQAPWRANPEAWVAGAGHGGGRRHGQRAGTATLSEDE